MDKLAKVRAEVARIQLYTQSEVLKQVLDYIDEVQKEPVIQNIITEPVGVPTGAVELANIPDKRSPTNEEIGDYDHKAVMESLHPQLKEEPVSEDLEKAATEYVKSSLVGSPSVKKNAFKAGAKWQKEQMMSKAIDGEILENYDGKVIKYDDTILDEKLSDCKVFDKVKIIVIKED